jgi:ectoine hydroxylase-related dioxygenase (phytanoyl-CoA dioxygenase family)
MTACSDPWISDAASGLYGPFPLSSEGGERVDALIEEVAVQQDKMNLHVTSMLALQVIRDREIVKQVRSLFGVGFRLWRTNFFQRQSGEAHPGVSWHHDKHFQDGDAELDYLELGDHVSILIALDSMSHDSGLFHYIPGSHTGPLFGCPRDRRPYWRRPLTDHFLALPDALVSNAAQLSIPAAHFCLFHSALLHSTAPSDGTKARLSMVGRLVSRRCRVPEPCAAEEQIVPFC